MKQNVIVISIVFSTALGAIRSLGEAGYGVKLLAMTEWTKRIAGKSKYTKECVKAKANFEDIFRGLEILRGKDEHILVIPLHDKSCMILDENADRLKEHYYLPNIHDMQGGISAFMDKMVQKQLARQCGMRVAEGRILSTKPGEIEKQELDQIRYPCFVKPLASSRCNAVKTLFAACHNTEELAHALENAGDHQCDQVLAEDLLDIEKEISAYGFAINGEVYLPARMDVLEGGYGRHKGVAAQGLISSAANLGEIKNQLIEFVKRSGYSGLFCFDLIQSKGDYYFSEMNLRCGGSSYAVTKAGANLFAAYADMVYQNPTKGPEDIQREVHFISEMIEWDAVTDGYVTLKEYRKCLSQNAVRFVWSKEDRIPWILFRLRGFKSLLAKKLKR